MITQDLFENAMTFDEFYQHMQDLYAEGKTTGDNQSQEYLDYTKLGIQRIKRGLKTTKIEGGIIDMINSTKATNWMIITEAWCGDGANSIPLIAKLAELREDITLKVIVRDEHPVVMDNYLTNGARSIPILILLDDNFNELKIWGPRPKPAQDMVMQNKFNPTLESNEFKISLQKWYLNDKNQTTLSEFEEILFSLA